ncbi:MAG: type II secretion system protein [Candidatus Saccharibacteria bacterium]|nr:type II secretion system protein [Candidatus Saccharibacteria bacterium]
MKRTSGFTVIELISAVVLVFLVGTLVLIQKNNIDASSRDQQRKTFTNSIYYGLKNGYFTQKGSYPASIDKATLPYVDPKSFDLVGSDPKYTLHYKGLDCDGNSCKGFEIRINLEKEAVYKKSSD